MFTVPGHPVGKGRPRFARGRAYTPETTRKAEHRVAAIASDAMLEAGIKPVRCPVRVQIIAWFEPRKSWSKKKRLDALGNEIRPGKPDLDNIAKLILDAINGVVFEDDEQVVELLIKKEFSDRAVTRVYVEW